MTMKICSIDGCDRPMLARTWCGTHYWRWSKYGDPLKLSAPHLVMTAEERFRTHYSEGDAGDCWEWQGTRSSNGYGKFIVHYKQLSAHRVSYELAKGEIPNGYHIDHLCMNPPCVNPHHLESVTPKVNTHRAMLALGTGVGKTHCPKGHPYDEKNTSVRPDGRRHCKACNREYARRKREEKRSAA